MKLKTLITLSTLWIVLDQLTKYLVLNKLTQQEQITVIPNFFNIVLTYNYGVAFGMFSTLSPLLRTSLISLVSVLAFAFLFYYYSKAYRNHFWGSFAISLIIGGAIGNIIDRFCHGAVVDFIDWYYGTWHWPAFNIADSCICIGVFLLILIPEKKAEQKAQTETNPVKASSIN